MVEGKEEDERERGIGKESKIKNIYSNTSTSSHPSSPPSSSLTFLSQNKTLSLPK
jgi:hypothetical protein